MSNVRECLVVSVNGCARVILRLCMSACVLRAYMGVFTHDLPHVSRSRSLFAAQFAETHLYSTVQSKRKKVQQQTNPVWLLQSSISFVLQMVARRGHCLTTCSLRTDD